MSEKSEHVDLGSEIVSTEASCVNGKNDVVLTGSAAEKEEEASELSKEGLEMEAEKRDGVEPSKVGVEEGKGEKMEDLSVEEGVEDEETDLKLSRDCVNEVPVLAGEGKSGTGIVEGVDLVVDEKGGKASSEAEKEDEETANVESFEALPSVSEVLEHKPADNTESVRVSANDTSIVEDEMEVDFDESLNQRDSKVNIGSETTLVLEDEMKVDFDESLNQKDSKVNIGSGATPIIEDEMKVDFDESLNQSDDSKVNIVSDTTPVIEDEMKVDFDESLTPKNSGVNSEAEAATSDEPQSGKSKLETKAEPKKSAKKSEAMDIVIDLTPKKGASKDGKKKSTASKPDFKVGDLIWGKVRSHPWWPGQICDPKAASKKAKKYFKRDAFLIAYYGDNTFAWNESTLMKPFLENFSQMEKQSHTEDFHFAIDCALEEISRRVEFSLICPCVSEEIYEEVKSQIIVNAGIKEEVSKREGGDRSLTVSSFKPAKLVEYIKELAQNPKDGANDRLEFAVSQSELLAFSHWKGYPQLPEFTVLGMILENDADVAASSENKQNGERKDNDLASEIETSKSSSRKCKLESKDSTNTSSKEKNTSDLVVDKKLKTLIKENASQRKATGKKRKARDNFSSPEPKKLVKEEGNKNVQSPRPSFRVGESIRRVASQLNGSSPILKNGIKDPQSKDEETKTPEEPEPEKEPEPNKNSTSEDNSSSEDDEQSLEDIFGGKRSAAKRNKSSKLGDLPHQIGPMNDSYWSERIGRSVPEKEDENPDLPLGSSRMEKDRTAPVSDAKREIPESILENKEEEEDPSPTALILNFSDSNSVPSETNLNKIFGHYGSLSEAETEILKKSNRAKVIFKKRSDAETAFSSAGKYSTFGPALVSYRLKYLASSPAKGSPKKKRSDADK